MCPSIHDVLHDIGIPDVSSATWVDSLPDVTFSERNEPCVPGSPLACLGKSRPCVGYV